MTTAAIKSSTVLQRLVQNSRSKDKWECRPRATQSKILTLIKITHT